MVLMLPSCTSCVPSCSLFPRSAGGKVMLPPLTSGPVKMGSEASGSSHDCAMTNNHALERLAQEPRMHPTCLCHRDGCIRPSSSPGRPILRNEPAGNYFNGHNHVLHQRRQMDTGSDIDITGRATSSRQPLISPRTPIPSPHDRKTASRPTTAAATVSPSPPIDVTISQQAAAKADLTSSVRTFRFKNSSMCGQNANRRDTKSPSSRLSPSDTDGSLKEINVTRRARRQIYLKPDVEGSPFRLLMYVDCRSVEPSQEMDVT